MYMLSRLAVFALALFYSTLVRCAPTPVGLDETPNLEARAASFPSVDGRLFRIDGKTQYFAGQSIYHALDGFVDES